MNIHSRAEWGARPPKAILAPGTIEGIIAHWVGADVSASPSVETVFSWLRNTQATEMAGVYNDLSYSYVVDGLGRVYQGHDPRVRQGASNAYNSRTLSICYYGGPNTPFTDAAQAAITELCQLLATQHHVLSYVWPHRKVRPTYTQCPGDTIIAWLPTIPLHEEPHMPLDQNDINAIVNALRSEGISGAANEAHAARTELGVAKTEILNAVAAVSTGDLTAEQIQEAVKQALREGTE